MTIEYRTGNLFTTDITHIAHGCNAQGVMGKGIALSVKNLYPEAYEEYRRQWLRNSSLVPGTIMLVPASDKIIINAITQKYYAKSTTDPNRYVSYDAVADCMMKLNELLPGKQIAMPRIGASLGGGNWEILAKIIEECLTDAYPVVYTL